MRVFVVVCLLAVFGVSKDNLTDAQMKFYESLIDSLKPNEIALMVQNLSTAYLPSKINENITLKNIKAYDTTLVGEFGVDKDSSNLKQKLISGTKDELCANNLFVKVLDKGLVMVGNFSAKKPFKIVVDRKFCGI
ncbi:hypothetical protein [Campylobacter mucosalis]|uniref:hypothetical protein n=1 Tax=Campylobacter mucosalis TaxID=202 RepID=UPI0014700790|nr:hypothetical protein [Campylobacter mucosalis]